MGWLTGAVELLLQADVDPTLVCARGLLATDYAVMNNNQNAYACIARAMGHPILENNPRGDPGAGGQ